MNDEHPGQPAVTSRGIDLWNGWHRAVFADASLLDEIPNGVTLILLPEQDPELLEAELSKGLAAARAGQNVYFRHVVEAELAAIPRRSSPETGTQRRTSFNRDGSVKSLEVLGDDGAWHTLATAAMKRDS